MPGPDEGSELPAAASPGRARDLVRRRTRMRAVPETGRQHHLGAAPAAMPVLGAEGAAVTRTADVQLAARTRHELTTLAAEITAEMTGAAARADFETAAARRDELSRVRAELARRA